MGTSGRDELPSPVRPSLSRSSPPSRRAPGLGLWVGMGLLAAYLAAGLSALFVFRGSLGELRENTPWKNPVPGIGPSWAHPFGIMPGFGVDLFRALWQATPWDLAIVAGILTIDVLLGFFLGAVAGLNEGGLSDAVVTFVGDSLAAIPPFFLALVTFAGLSVLASGSYGIPLFVVVFGLILWPTLARTVRERARSVAREPFVEASRASGATGRQLLLRHILPNSVGPVLAQVPLDVAPIFFVLAAFPWFYNCAGPSPPLPPGPFPGYLIPQLPSFSPLPSAAFPEWGYLLGIGTCEGLGYPGGFNDWWMYLFPLLAILVLGFAIALVCDGTERWRQLGR